MKASTHRRLRWPYLLILLFLSLALPLPAAAWNSAGHRLTAWIAWRQLDVNSRAAVGKLLRQHPDYPHWQAQGQGDDADLNAFVEASTWPDDIRQDARFYTAGETPTPTLPGFPDMERRRHWHYVDQPIPPSGRQRPSDGVLDLQLAALIDTLGRGRTPTVERVYALPWLIHLVGDAHQPLHAASRFSDAGHGDRGGNELTIDNPFAAAHEPTDNLHRYWDALAGAPWLRGERLARRAAALMQRYPADAEGAIAPAGASANGRSAAPSQWLLESWRIAAHDAYPPANAAAPTISAEFDARSKEIAQQRVVLAGYRLAALLQRLLRDSALR